MIGFVNRKGEPVGEADFLRLQAKERIKAHVKVIGSCLKDTTRMTSHGVSSTNMNKTAKRVLRILSTCSLLEIADGYEVDGMSPSPEALGLWSYVFDFGHLLSNWVWFSCRQEFFWSKESRARC